MSDRHESAMPPTDKHESDFEQRLRARLVGAAQQIEVPDYVPRSVRRRREKQRNLRTVAWLGAAAASIVLVGVVANNNSDHESEGRVGVAADPPRVVGGSTTTTSTLSSLPASSASTLLPAAGIPRAVPGRASVASSSRGRSVRSSASKSSEASSSSTAPTTSAPTTASTSASSSRCPTDGPPLTSFVPPTVDNSNYSELSSISRSLASLGPTRTSFPLPSTTVPSSTAGSSCVADE